MSFANFRSHFAKLGLTFVNLVSSTERVFPCRHRVGDTLIPTVPGKRVGGEKLVEVGLGPTHGVLDGDVPIKVRVVCRHQNPAPDGRRFSSPGDGELENVWGIRA